MANRKLVIGLSANAASTLLAAGVILDVTHSAKRECNKDSVSVFHRCIGFKKVFPFSHINCEGSMSETEAQRFDKALAHHRSQISSYRRRWEYSADSSATISTTIPSRSWPDSVPPEEDLPFLLEDIKYCDRSRKFMFDKNNNYCDTLRFRVASSLLMQYDDESQKKGLDMLKTLAEKDHRDAMVFYGMCLNDGRAGMEPNPKAAVSCFVRCSNMHQHPHSQYELGVAYYTGEGVTENEEEAVRLFKLAADNNHPAACYMLGDCLLDGIGIHVDRALALEWLVRAAELGHRGARSRVMAVLEKREGEEYGRFTDASRQTLLSEQAVSFVNKEGDNRNPAELVRRQTIVGKSRKGLY